ncbi:subtilisin-like protein [Mycena olivaceomarginata]|nr:subtilisin-like protein [Mycena olivaceomarginata]
MPFRKLANLFTIISAVSASLVVHESRRAAPVGFFSQGAAPVTEVGLQEKLVSISTPGNSDFRQWLSKDQVKSFVQPSNETVAAFNSFAAANGLKPTVANHLFGAQFEKFSHASLTEPITRTLTISLPSELIGHVDVVHPQHIICRPQSGFCPATLPCPTAPRNGPSALRPAIQAGLTKNNKLLVTGYIGTSPNRTDLSTFLEQFRLDMPPNTTFDLITIDNSTGQSPPEFPVAVLEADLDIEYTVGLATGVPTVLSRILRRPFRHKHFLDGLDNPPHVVTTSYGPMENQFESSVSKKICDSYMALGARGISVLFGSGDGGVRGSHDNSSIPGFCESNIFIPVFPASCPYVTAVGGTQGFSPEVAVNLTGGGFSDLFPRPWYQTQAVDSFLKTIPPDFAGTFNKSGRGYPDVAVQGWGLDLVFNGTTFATGGTSFSSPIFASIIALPVLGFLNPFIYANKNAFTDITEGHNSGFECPTSSVAFDATKGWDALTGIGSPVFDKLLAAAFKY